MPANGRWDLTWCLEGQCVNLIIVSSTCSEHPSVHPQEDMHMQLYGISFMLLYKQSGRWQDVLDTCTCT
jgi:hypothetical protein